MTAEFNEDGGFGVRLRPAVPVSVRNSGGPDVKIYTKTGDDGRTGLLGPGRVSKSDARIDAYGDVDELNAVVGLARASGLPPSLDGLAAILQSLLFSVGAALADPAPDGPFHRSIGPDKAAMLEEAIDAAEDGLSPLNQFILPGGSPAAAALHVARTVCRRAERKVVALSETEGESVPVDLLICLNRLSDLLFVMARAANDKAGVADVPWTPL